MLHVKHVCVLLPLVRPYIRHVYVLLPLVMPHIRHAHLGLYIGVILEGRTTHIWSFACSFACATTMRCAGFRLSFDMTIVL